MSPVIAGIILFVLDDLSMKRQDQNSAGMIRPPMDDPKAFVNSIIQVKELFDRKILTETEFKTRKTTIIEGLQWRSFPNGPEGFLTALVPLLDNDALTREDLEQIKAFVLPKKYEFDEAC